MLKKCVPHNYVCAASCKKIKHKYTTCKLLLLAINDLGGLTSSETWLRLKNYARARLALDIRPQKLASSMRLQAGPRFAVFCPTAVTILVNSTVQGPFAAFQNNLSRQNAFYKQSDLHWIVSWSLNIFFRLMLVHSNKGSEEVRREKCF